MKGPATKGRAMNLPVQVANFLLLIGIGTLLYHLPFGTVRGRQEGALSALQPFQRGNANGDHLVDLSDTVFVLEYLFQSGEEPECLAAADVNDDGLVDIADPIYLLFFLFQGGTPPPQPYPEPGPDPTVDLACDKVPLPPVGSPGGPDRALNEEEEGMWLRGRQLFDRPATVSQGLGPTLNGDSCRGCHLDPVLGGSGGLDVNVVRFAHVDEQGAVSQLPGGPAASRHTILDVVREECPEEANVIENRQTPTLLGLGLVDRVPENVILANADPDDLKDGDGITGRARMVDGMLGRFGHKCGVPDLVDFTADALFNELGLTLDPINTPFAGVGDSDAVDDPEMSDQEFADLVFFVSHIAPPPRQLPEDPLDLQQVQEGEQIFQDLQCDACHVQPEKLDGVPAYSDFLLHDVADPDRYQVSEPGVDPREFRTAPLWGLVDTAPYLHDGSGETIREAILDGHHGEAEAARNLFDSLDLSDKIKLEDFLESL